MMTPRGLIVGGGIAGMATAIVLGRLGLDIELIDLDPQWRVYGAGITITRPTMRAFRELGLLEPIIERGFAGDGIVVCTPDGTPVDVVADPPIAGPPLPGSGGIMRPELHRILSAAVRDTGTDVRLGLTVETLADDGAGVDVLFSDGGTRRYDFVIGADGIGSRIRGLLFPDAPPAAYTGQTIWRLHARRPPEIDRRHFFLGGNVKVGVCPVSATHLYMFLLERTERRAIIPDHELYVPLRDLLEGFGGVLATLREGLCPTSPIVVRPLETFLLPAPWNRGRSLVIGDAAHPTTPQLASGAGLAVEDAIVLGDEMRKAAGDVPAAFQGFMERRWERCRLVVSNSIEIGRREQSGAAAERQTILVAQSLAKLAEPI